MNSFIDNSVATFQPYVDVNDGINDATLWNSANPLGAIQSLNMLDNGSVIVSDFKTDSWTVSTIRTPIDGAHPVSGNRKWGYNVDGTGYKFYVTAVGRISKSYVNFIQLLTDVPFTKADQLWASYQTKVAAFVNSHSGNAAVVASPIKERPNYQALKDYFDGKITLAQLKALKGCN